MTRMASMGTVSGAGFDVRRIRDDFPILRRTVHGRPLVYLDNAATTQKPRAVVDTVAAYYAHDNANVHRGVHMLSERATGAFEDARTTVQRFLNAASAREIVFTRNATEGINLVAQTFGRTRLGPGDEVVISAMEHHSNIVPWQMICRERGASLRVIPITDAGDLQLEEYDRLLGPSTRLVAIVHLSNALGTINPVRQMIAAAHGRGVPVLVDGSQAAPHMSVDVQALDADFYVITGHKLYGPTGIGALYGKERLLEEMPPYQGGGDMISSVTFEKTTYNALPYKFEAGTPNISGAVGLAAALHYITAIGVERIAAHERDVLEYGTASLSSVPGLTLIGTAREKAGVLSFVMDGVHPHDIGTVADERGVAIRTGHHCAQPLMQRLGIAATARASVALYNTRQEIDVLVEALHRVRELFT
jgi:cysteine desulfurase/selenocysteine lyase